MTWIQQRINAFRCAAAKADREFGFCGAVSGVAPDDADPEVAALVVAERRHVGVDDAVALPDREGARSRSHILRVKGS